MRTSPSQFEVMLDFMERNGDLNKPADGPSGRLRAIQKWEELKNALNLDTTGTAKPVDKWKKVWSDFKNNSKRKAARIDRAAGGTGGGPACTLTLTDLEQRVISLIGPQAASGLDTIREVGLELAGPSQLSTAGSLPPGTEVSPTSTPLQLDNIVDSGNTPGTSHSTPFATEVVDVDATSPTRHHAQSPERRAPRRVLLGRRRRSLSTPAPGPPSRTRHAVNAFLASDEHWRALATQFTIESLRLRQVELEQQAQWQTLFAKLLEVMESIINK